MSQNNSDPFAHCADTVQREDPDRFTICQFMPKRHRGHAYAIIALDLELMSIPQKVTTDLLADMRFQWWQDRVEALREGQSTPGSPVFAALETLPEQAFEPLLALITEHRRESDYPGQWLSALASLMGKEAVDDGALTVIAGNLARARTGAALVAVNAQSGKKLPRALRPCLSLTRIYEQTPKEKGREVKILPPHWMAIVLWRQLTP